MDKLEDTAKEENIEDPPSIRQDLVKSNNYKTIIKKILIVTIKRLKLLPNFYKMPQLLEVQSK